MARPLNRCGALLALLLFASCEAVPSTYVQADRATFDAIAPAHRAYVEADATLDEQQKARRIRTLETWLLRLEKAEGAR